MDELSDEERKRLRSKLVEVQRELRKLVLDSEGSSKPVSLDQPIGRLSRMDAIQQQQMASENRRSQRRRLVLIDHALRAVEDGSYGLCSRCEEPIGFGRLNARPETPLCLTCQGANEGP